MKFRTYQNMGDGDRVIRVLAGAILIAYVMGATVDKLGWLSLLPLAAIPLIMTAILKWDPIYGLFDFNTEKENRINSLGFMASNIGSVDTVIRYVAGSALLVATLVFAPAPIGLFALVPIAAAVLILTGMIAWDPIYAAFKLNTLEQVENLPTAVVINADFASSGNEDITVRRVPQGESQEPQKVA